MGGYLSDAVVLQVDDSGHGHLHAAKNGHHLQDLIIEGRSCEGLTETHRPSHDSTAQLLVTTRELPVPQGALTMTAATQTPTFT